MTQKNSDNNISGTVYTALVFVVNGTAHTEDKMIAIC